MRGARHLPPSVGNLITALHEDGLLMSRIIYGGGNHREIDLLLRRLDHLSPLVEPRNESSVQLARDELFVDRYLAEERQRRRDS